MSQRDFVFFIRWAVIPLMMIFRKTLHKVGSIVERLFMPYALKRITLKNTCNQGHHTYNQTIDSKVNQFTFAHNVYHPLTSDTT